MSLGIQCLLTDDMIMARDIAQQLDELNRDRRAIEADMQREALSALESLHLNDQTRCRGDCACIARNGIRA